MKMIVSGILLCLIFSVVKTSATLYGNEVFSGEQWWSHSRFLKFNSPSGKNYLIEHKTGEIGLERLDPLSEKVEDQTTLPYISFVSLNFKIYDIYFEHQQQKCIPRIVETRDVYDDKSTFIRHSLHSFVGPNNEVYKLSYNNASDITIVQETPAQHLDHLEIKTLGPYSKWEHTYIFSKNGDVAEDLIITPAKALVGQSIPIPEMDSNILKNKDLLLLNYKTPSGNKYLFTNDLNIALANDDVVEKNLNEPYIHFVEPDRREYDIYFRDEGDMPRLVPVKKQSDDEENLSGLKDVQVISFIGPNKKLYEIGHMKDENGRDSPNIDYSKKNSPNLQVTFLITNKYYKKYIKFVFCNDGKEFCDRVEEFDWTPLSEQPPLKTDEIEQDSEIAKLSFLKFMSPSGKNYYLTPTSTKANLVVGDNKAESAYIIFGLQDGRKSYIYYTPGQEPYMELKEADGNNSTAIYSLVSFVTPDKKLYKIRYYEENDVRIPYIDPTSQPIDPLDGKPIENLEILISSTIKQYKFLFTWDGDKLVKAISIPGRRVSANVLKSLIG